jgi:hypothetical protein
MVKEAKNIDFYTTGKEPSALDFQRISQWIAKRKTEQAVHKKTSATAKHITSHNVAKK